MARAKKDGRHINYYIERDVYDRLKRYADSKGQIMTTAIERIITEYLDGCGEHAGGADAGQSAHAENAADDRNA